MALDGNGFMFNGTVNVIDCFVNMNFIVNVIKILILLQNCSRNINHQFVRNKKCNFLDFGFYSNAMNNAFTRVNA